MVEKLKVQNPFDLKVLEELELVSESTVREYIAKADKIVENKDWLPKVKRIDILKRLVGLISENKSMLIEQAVREGGKPFQDSKVEIERGMDGIEVAIEALKHLGGHEIPMNITNSSLDRIAFTVHRPRGLAVAISAFNHPFNLIIHQVIPAVAAGCPVLVKPASTTPLSCRSIVQLLYEAGLPEDYCRMVFCSNEVAEKLVTNPSTRFLSFIGSAKVGWYLRSKLPPGAMCALEHGGAAPAIIDESADLNTSIPSIVKGGYYHAGQVCVSVQRVFVHDSIKEKFLNEFNKQVSKLNTGDPMDQASHVGPLITPNEVQRVSAWVEEAKEKGARCTLGGQAQSASIYSPTVLVDTPMDAKIAQNEIFGPVTTIRGFTDFSEAIFQANNVDFAFQASVFTERLERALQASQELEGLSIMINDHTAFRVDWMPFGGYKQSGLGVGGIGHSLKDMSIEKMVVMKSKHLG